MQMQAAQAQFQTFDSFNSDVMNASVRLDGHNADDLQRNAKLHIQVGSKRLILDFSRTTYMTAGGMHALLGIAKLMREKQCGFAVCGLQGQPKQMFAACGFDLYIPSCETQDAAVLRLAA